MKPKQKRKSWNWRIFKNQFAAGWLVITLTALLSYKTAEWLTAVAIFGVGIGAFYAYKKRTKDLTDYSAVSYLLGAWIGGIAALVIFLSFFYGWAEVV